MLEQAKAWARGLKKEIMALWIAARDPRTPIVAKVMAALVAAYALSPIDLIPDFVPLLGYLDDLLLVPLGIAIAVRLIPAPLMADFRERAAAVAKRQSVGGMLAVVAIWAICLVMIGWLVLSHWG